MQPLCKHLATWSTKAQREARSKSSRWYSPYDRIRIESRACFIIWHMQLLFIQNIILVLAKLMTHIKKHVSSDYLIGSRIWHGSICSGDLLFHCQLQWVRSVTSPKPSHVPKSPCRNDIMDNDVIPGFQTLCFSHLNAFRLGCTHTHTQTRSCSATHTQACV